MNVCEVLNLTGDICHQMQQFVLLLQQWNHTYRLIGTATIEEICDKHLADAAAMLPYIIDRGHCIDLGSGAGLPGIPLKILRQNVTMTLVEAQLRRINFCRRVRQALSLEGLHVVHGRVEDREVIANVGHGDLVISRATWKLPEFLRLALPYLASRGTMIALKSVHWQEEMRGEERLLDELGFHDAEVVTYTLPLSGQARALVMFRRRD